MSYRSLVWYRDGISVRYRDGRADWIQVTGLGRYLYEPQTLRLFGVSCPCPPSDSSRAVLRWDGRIPSFAVVTLHSHPRHRGAVDYVNFWVSGEPRDSVF